MPVSQRAAATGERQIQVTVRFATDAIADEDGFVLPGFCWEGGFVNVESNRSHGIQTTEGRPFSTLEDLLPAIFDVLNEAGVNVIFRADSRTRRPRLKG